ncbi:MAG: hypothetical protein ACRD4E_13860 [Bryobacteraceae bacterium]
MKTLGAIAIVICLATAGCGYHDRYDRYGYDRYSRRSEIRRAQEDVRRARQDVQRQLREAREEFRREMRDARRDFRDEFGRR